MAAMKIHFISFKMVSDSVSAIPPDIPLRRHHDRLLLCFCKQEA